MALGLHFPWSNVLCDDGGRYTYAAVNSSRNLNSIERTTGAHIDYKELTYGSFAGLFVGIILGKLSKVLVILAGGIFLFVQFLTSRGIISLPYNRLYGWARGRFGNKEFILENMSFKLAFGSAMIVTAANI
ncbi:hypothetical protein V1514DRAFT_320530 [Lipomyces japonicus]|uniref:uncharacterized protein n=1 Tax=Lipomyces japonicus TaxID=56871 RepID=UPI0034CD8D4B